MLQITPERKPAARPRKPRDSSPLSTITAENIAKTPRDKRECARLAALLVSNRLTLIKPTTTLAAAIFHVSQPMVRAEMKKLKAAHPGETRTAADAIFAALDEMTA